MKSIVLKNYRLGLLAACLFLSPIYIYSQDLGSSSGLFKKKSTTSKKTSTKKKSSTKKKTSSKKKKSTRSKRKSTRAKKRKTSPKKKSTRSSRSSRRRSTTARKTSRTRKKSTPTSKKVIKPKDNLVINVGEDLNVDKAELFEQSIAEGNKARNLREYVKAEESYSLARTIDPKDSRAIYGLGNIYSDQQRWQRAEKAYRNAIEIEPDNPSAHIAISFVLTQPIVGSNIGKRYEEAEKMARRAIVLDPNNAIGYDQLGVSLELRGFIGDETENAYRKAIDLVPGFALAYAHLGRLLRRHGFTKRSSAAYRQAKKLSTDVPTMILVADVMQSQQRYEDSEILLRKALAVDDRNPTGLYLLGRALTTRKSYAEAEAILKKSVEVSPNSFVSYTLLGTLYYQSGKLEKAEQTLMRAISVTSLHEKKRLAQEFEEVGDRYMKAEQHADAVRVYNRAKELDKSKASLRIKLAKAVKK